MTARCAIHGRPTVAEGILHPHCIECDRDAGRTVYTADELRDLPTLSVGQIDSLKIDTGTERVWVCRGGVEDGLPYDDMVMHEEYDGDRWITTREYQG